MKLAQKFAQNFLTKCDQKDYSEIVGFKISKGFQAKLASDSIKRFCEYTTEKRGKITLGKLVSAHTARSPRDFLDVFNFQIKTEKSA